MKNLSIALGLLACATVAHAETPVLTVLTYDSFVAEWGPGPAIEAGFEATCACDLRFIAAGDGAALLARIRLEGAASETDVVVGLDTSLTEAARATGLFAPHGLTLPHDLPVDYADAEFLPYDWGWFAFVYDKTKLAAPPVSFEALAASDVKIVLQDPRSSTPGLGLVLWVKAVFGDRAPAIWADLADNIVTVTPGWSEAYGLFLEGEADMVLSYTTSPAYHLIAEGDDTKAAAAFTDGHSLQVEVSGMLASTDQPALAAAFLTYLGTQAQAVLPQTNWMYPAKMPEAGLDKGFDGMIKPEVSLLMSAADAEAVRAPAIAEWQATLSR